MKHMYYLEHALNAIGCKCLLVTGNDARSFEPTEGPLKNKVWSVLLAGSTKFFFDEAGLYIGNDSDTTVLLRPFQLDFNFTLQCALGSDKPVTGNVVSGSNANENMLQFHFDGFGERNAASADACPVLIENREGVPHVLIWGDINQEDPTHVISLAGADLNLDRYEETE